jgi:electron transfer flavoprotein alpha subunit
MVGVRGAGQVLAVNSDPDALVFQSADVGIVGDWHEVIPRLVTELLAQRATERVEAG